jgi:hypothetical protein
MDPYSPYNKGKRARKYRQHWHGFRGCFKYFSYYWAVQISPYNRLRAHFSRCIFLGRSYNNTYLAHFSRQNFGGLF